MDLINLSISPEVYVINLVVGMAVFFTLRWVFKKFIKADKLRVRLTWICTIILTPIIYLSLILIYVSALFYQPTRDFDRTLWFAEKERRFEMKDDLINSGILIDKSRKEVIDLIGAPNFGTTDTWHYDLGISGAGFGWQFNSLHVIFVNDKVIKVEKQEIID